MLLSAMSHPCVRGICRRCGQKTGIFGILSFGLSTRYHEQHCRAVGPVDDDVAELPQTTLQQEAGPACQEIPTAQDAPRPGLLASARLLVPCVDASVDPRELREEDLLRFLYVSKAQMLRMQAADQDTTEELMRVAIVSWKPGIDEHCPLKAALAHGPAEGGFIRVKARPPRMRVLFEQTVDVHMLADGLPKRVDTRIRTGFPRFGDSSLHNSAAAGQAPQHYSNGQPCGG